MAAQEKVLELKHQLAALDAGQTGGTGEAILLAQQIAGIEKLKADPVEEARGVAATFSDDGLKKMLEQLPKLQEQEAKVKTNSGTASPT